MAKIGIVGGSGKLPIIFSDAARKKGEKVIGIGLKGVTDPALESHVDKIIWVDLGAVQKTIFAVVAERISKIALLGKLNKELFFKNNKDLDADTKTFAGKLNDMKDYSLLNKAAAFLGKFGIEIMDPTPYLVDLLPQKGVLTRRNPSEAEAADIEYARSVARELARLDIGQTVAVKSKTVIALEAMEGTDETMARAGALSKQGFIIAKVARPDQDMRFDVPLVGLETIEALARAGGTALALEAGRTFLIDREAIIKFADEKNISVVVV
jgi:Uncharacterized protein conserved in bacteria